MNRFLVLLLLFLTNCSGCHSSVLKSSLIKTQSALDYKGKVLFQLEKPTDDVVASVGEFKIYDKDLQKDEYLKELKEKRENLKNKLDNESKNNYLLHALESDIFRRQLVLIEKIVKENAMAKEARNLEISLAEYIQTYIYSRAGKNITPAEISEFLKDKIKPDGMDPSEWATHQILKNNEKKSIDYVLEKYILQLPIKVYLSPPRFDVDINHDWTPHWGPKNASHNVVVFSSTQSHADQLLLNNILELKDKYQNLFVGYRPIANKNNPNQMMTTYMQLCVWMNERDKFWDYLQRTLGDHKDKTEDKLLSTLKEMNMESDKIKKCFFSQEYKEVMDYHQSYNKFLGIESGPIVFVTGEVLHGVVSVDDIDSVLNRQLSLPSAALWE